MKRRIGWIILCFLCMQGWAQPAYLGTKTPYVPPHTSYTPAPAGYQPVFINYVGRHGARFLTKAGADLRVLEVLEAAEKDHELTDMGKRVKEIVERLAAAGKGSYENITLLGMEEQEAIGERMRLLYSGVFTGRGLVIRTTWKMRTQQSAEAFLKGFSGYVGEKRYERAADSTDTTLRFYDLSPAYAKYKKSSILKRALDSLDKDGRTMATAKRVCDHLFVSGFVPSGGVIAFADDLYDLYSIAWSMSGELRARGDAGDSEGLGVVFEKADLEWFDFRSGAADFLEKGPGLDSAGIQVKVAVPLLADFIQSLDRATASSRGGIDGVLRFTHAEAIAPFAALLGMGGASTPVRSIYKYHDHWDAGNVIPLSANIQCILYAGKKQGDFLVKLLLNEREVRLPVGTRTWPYYRWGDVRAYYVQKLAAVHAGLGTDMMGYLRGVE